MKPRELGLAVSELNIIYLSLKIIYVCASVGVSICNSPSAETRDFVGVMQVSWRLDSGHQALQQPTLSTEIILWNSFVGLSKYVVLQTN